MFLCIAFNGETIPFLLHDSDEECLMAIEVAKKTLILTEKQQL